jgi:hypothetical protein
MDHVDLELDRSLLLTQFLEEHVELILDSGEQVQHKLLAIMLLTRAEFLTKRLPKCSHLDVLFRFVVANLLNQFQVGKRIRQICLDGFARHSFSVLVLEDLHEEVIEIRETK